METDVSPSVNVNLPENEHDSVIIEDVFGFPLELSGGDNTFDPDTEFDVSENGPAPLDNRNVIFDFLNNNAVVVGKDEDHESEDAQPLNAEKDTLGIDSCDVVKSDRSRILNAKSTLMKTSGSTAINPKKKYVPVNFVRNADRVNERDESARVTAAAVSAAMSAALPFMKDQSDLQHQVRDLLDKINRLENEKIKLEEKSQFEHTRQIERHLADLTEKRLQLLERVLAKEEAPAATPETEVASLNSSVKFYPKHRVLDMKVDSPVKYTKVSSAPARAALLSKVATPAKKNDKKSRALSPKTSKRVQTKYLEASPSIEPRRFPPQPADSNILLKEILGSHNESAHSLFNTTGQSLNRHDRSIAEEKILSHLNQLKSEIQSLKNPQSPKCSGHCLGDLVSTTFPCTHGVSSSTSPAARPTSPCLEKTDSKLLSQYYKAYSTVSPVKLRDPHDSKDIEDAERILREVRAAKKRLDANTTGFSPDAHKRIDMIFRGEKPDDEMLMKSRVDREIRRVSAEIQWELKHGVKPAEKLQKPKTATKVKPVVQPRYQQPLLKPRTDLRNAKPSGAKPVATVRPNANKPNRRPTVAAPVTLRAQEPKEEAQTTIIAPPIQSLYHQLMKQPPGVTLQPAGLLYNREFFPMRRKGVPVEPEQQTVVVAQASQQVQTDTTTESPTDRHEVSRVRFESVVRDEPTRNLEIRHLPPVEISGGDQVEEKAAPRGKTIEPPAEVSDEQDESIDSLKSDDLIVVPGYKFEDPPGQNQLPSVSQVDHTDKYRAIQNCVEDEILSCVLRELLKDRGTADSEANESQDSDFGALTDAALKVFIVAGAGVDKNLVRQVAEDEILNMIVNLIGQREEPPAASHFERVPTPVATPVYTPVDSPNASFDRTPRFSPVHLHTTDRALSPIGSPPPTARGTTEPVDYSDDFHLSPDKEDDASQIQMYTSMSHECPTPQETPPLQPSSPVLNTPEMSVADVSFEDEVPAPAPKKVLTPEPAPVLPRSEMVDEGIQYEAPVEMVDRPTSPAFVQMPVARPDQRSPEETSSSEYHSATVFSETDGASVSEHEWMLPHSALRSEGEVTPPHGRSRGFFRHPVRDEPDYGDHSIGTVDSESEFSGPGTPGQSVALSEGEARPAVPNRNIYSIKGPVTEALFEMQHLLANNNDPYSKRQHVEAPRRIRPQGKQKTMSNVDMVAAKHTMDFQPNYSQEMHPGGDNADISDSKNTSSAFRLPLDGLASETVNSAGDTEPDISDIEDA